MEIRQLVTFTRVAQQQSFSRAAESLGYSQSAVTVQIQQLETELGIRLFDRIGRRVALTAQGNLFLKHAYDIQHEINQAKLAIESTGELTNPLHVGTLESLCFSKLPPILRSLRENHPGVAVRVTLASPEELIEMMEHNQLDLIYILDELRYSDKWNKAMEAPEPVVFVCTPNMPLAAQKHLRVEQLLDKPFFLTEQNANYRRALDQYLAAKSILLSPFLEVSNTEFIIRMIEENPGISLLPYFAVEESVKAGALAVLDVEDFCVPMYRQIFYHRDKWKTREMEEFIRLAAEPDTAKKK